MGFSSLKMMPALGTANVQQEMNESNRDYTILGSFAEQILNEVVLIQQPQPTYSNL